MYGPSICYLFVSRPPADHLANAPSTPTHVLINDVIDDDDALVSAASSSSRRKQSVSSRSRSRKLSVSSPSMSGAGAGGRRTSNSASLSTRRRVKMATRANGAGAGAAAVVPLCGDACGTIDLKEIKSIEPSEVSDSSTVVFATALQLSSLYNHNYAV